MTGFWGFYGTVGEDNRDREVANTRVIHVTEICMAYGTALYSCTLRKLSPIKCLTRQIFTTVRSEGGKSFSVSLGSSRLNVYKDDTGSSPKQPLWFP